MMFVLVVVDKVPSPEELSDNQNEEVENNCASDQFVFKF